MDRNKRFLIIQSILLAVVLVLLALGALRIFMEGYPLHKEDPFYEIYTASRVAERLACIAPLIFAAIGFTAAGWIMGIRDENDDKPVQDAEIMRDLTCARVQTPTWDMRKERSLQKKLFWIGWILFALLLIPVAMHCLNGAHFDNIADADQDLFALLRVYVPCVSAALCCLSVTTALRGRSMIRETQAAKAAMAEEKEAGIQAETKFLPVKAVLQAPEKKILIARWALLLLAIALLVLGTRNGGYHDVLKKATAICMECIGLG